MAKPSDADGPDTPEKKTPQADDPGKSVQVSATITLAEKERLQARADHEERELGVVIRRALRSYMDGWEPTPENR